MRTGGGDATVADLVCALRAQYRTEHALLLTVGTWSVRVESNSAQLIARLRSYFRHFVGGDEAPDCVIAAIEAEEPNFGLTFLDWARDGGKIGRKDTYADIGGGRVLRKVRTGMQFLMARDTNVAVGPCLANDNQVVNFINARYMTWMLHRDRVLCHAAAVTTRRGVSRAGVAVAGFSGGGKSTLALHLMTRGLSFVSNDRLLVVRDGDRALMSGVPKLPRINPGTALNNAALRDVLPEARRRELAGMSSGELWELEEKYDVEIDKVFDGAAFEIESPLNALLVLNWARTATEPTKIDRVDLADRRDLLAAVMKSPGPFHTRIDGSWPQGQIVVAEAPYVACLSSVNVYEASGRVDFEAASEACMNMLERALRETE